MCSFFPLRGSCFCLFCPWETANLHWTSWLTSAEPCGSRHPMSIDHREQALCFRYIKFCTFFFSWSDRDCGGQKEGIHFLSPTNSLWKKIPCCFYTVICVLYVHYLKELKHSETSKHSLKISLTWNNNY